MYVRDSGKDDSKDSFSSEVTVQSLFNNALNIQVMMIQDTYPDQDQHWDRSVSKASFVLVYLMSGPSQMSGTQLFLSTDQLTIQSQGYWYHISLAKYLHFIYISLFPFQNFFLTKCSIFFIQLSPEDTKVLLCLKV